MARGGETDGNSYIKTAFTADGLVFTHTNRCGINRNVSISVGSSDRWRLGRKTMHVNTIGSEWRRCGSQTAAVTGSEMRGLEMPPPFPVNLIYQNWHIENRENNPAVLATAGAVGRCCECFGWQDAEACVSRWKIHITTGAPCPGCTLR